jgi:hypothetical protein
VNGLGGVGVAALVVDEDDEELEAEIVLLLIEFVITG